MLQMEGGRERGPTADNKAANVDDAKVCVFVSVYVWVCEYLCVAIVVH